MKIAIDDGFSMTRPTGIGRYTAYIMSALAQHAPQLRVRSVNLSWLQAVRPRQLRRLVYLAWLATGYPWQQARSAPDIIHFTNYQVAFWKPRQARYAVTIHDMSPFRWPDSKSNAYIWYVRRSIRQAVQQADIIFADTYTVKQEIIEDLGVSESKIHVCYIGSDISPLPLPQAQHLIQRLIPPLNNHPFLLFVGSLERRKNLVPLVQAFGLLQKPHLHLILAGRPGIGFEQIEEAINPIDPSHQNIHLLAQCTDEDLRALYSTCKVFIFPSLYEGYGIPLLEAMTCGAPIVASDISTNRELLQGLYCKYAGLIVQNQPEAFATAIEQILTSPTLSAQLVSQGQKRVCQFTPQQTAQQLMAGYDSVMGNRTRIHADKRG